MAPGQPKLFGGIEGSLLIRMTAPFTVGESTINWHTILRVIRTLSRTGRAVSDAASKSDGAADHVFLDLQLNSAAAAYKKLDFFVESLEVKIAKLTIKHGLARQASSGLFLQGVISVCRQCVAKCSHLQSIDVDLTLPDCSFAQIEGLHGLTELSALKSLTLDLPRCNRLVNLDGLQGLAELTALQSLSMDLRRCATLANIDGLQSLASRGTLQTLSLVLDMCPGLTNSDDARTPVIRGLAGLTSLKSLTLSFRNYFPINSLHFGTSLAPTLGRSLAGLTALRSLSLDLSDEELENVDELESLTALTSLQSLMLDFRRCVRLANIGGLQS